VSNEVCVADFGKLGARQQADFGMKQEKMWEEDKVEGVIMVIAVIGSIRADFEEPLGVILWGHPLLLELEIQIRQPRTDVSALLFDGVDARGSGR
jgi:hypothetical protein